MKKYNIMFWIATGLIFIFEGVLVALTSHTEMSIGGFTHLGYPVYFVAIVATFKVLGSLALIIPRVPSRIKEWAYAGFAFDFISAFVSIAVVDGLIGGLVLPLVALVILVVSYVSYHKRMAVAVVPVTA